MDALVLGLDIGTQGVRCIITDLFGKVYTSKSVSFDRLNISDVPGHKVQEPEDWWKAAVAVLSQCASGLKAMGQDPANIRAMSIDATSGTVLALDKDNRPASEGIMYNDARADREAAMIGEFASELESALGYKVNASFGLPKIVWLNRKLPSNTGRYVHQSDFIIGKLTGEYGITDYSNALKTCYDLTAKKWPAFLNEIGIDSGRLPQVVAPGTPIGYIHKSVAEQTGLSEKTVVVAGATDGYASALSAGISVKGDWASIIGTTMVLKGVQEKLITDPKGRIYSHLHPQGYWLLGGASNVGGRCLNDHFGKHLFEEYNRYVPALSPTGVPCYPLFDRGERFPFVNPSAQGFIGDYGGDDKVKYTALMEGVGYAERLAYEMLSELGCSMKDEIFTAGGVCKSDEWLQIRSDILNKTLKVPEQTDAVMGAALLASLATGYETLMEASSNMIKIVKVKRPSKKRTQYEESYFETKRELEKRGYLA